MKGGLIGLVEMLARIERRRAWGEEEKLRNLEGGGGERLRRGRYYAPARCCFATDLFVPQEAR